MSRPLASFLPASIQNKNYPLEALKIHPTHLPSLVPLHMVYTILMKDQVAGFFYFKQWEGLQPDELEMAYCRLSAFRGKRILELMLLTILGSLFGTPIPNGKLDKVCAFVESDNDASKDAHKKLGIEKTGETRDTENPKIIYHRYEIRRESWEHVASRLETNIKQKW